MTLSELLATLNDRSIKLRRDGADLVIHGDEGAINPSLVAGLRQHKSALLDLVNKNGDGWWSPTLTITPEMLPLIDLTSDDIERIVSAVPGGAANIQDIYPLAPLQEGILFHHLMEAEGDVYLSSALLYFDTRARLDKYLQALQAVIDRHDILRTAILWEGLPEPAQVVWRRAPVIVEEISLDPADGEIAEQLQARFDPRRRRIDIRLAPLMRVYMAHDAPNGRWIVVWLTHHLWGDHTTQDAVLREIGMRLLGQADRLPAAPPFRNFVAQARLGVSREEHEAFFGKLLGDVDEPTAPFGLVDAQGDGSAIVEAWREVDDLLAKRLREAARALSVSAASLCHLAWAQVLARVSGKDDVVFGAVLFGRMKGGADADRALGMFMNTLPARIRIGGDNARDSVRQTHMLLAQLMRHEHASLALAQRCSAVAAPAPLFTTLLNCRRLAGDPISPVEAPAEAMQVFEGMDFHGARERNNYPLCLNVDDSGEGLTLNAQAQAPIDPERICAYMHTALETLVEALEHAPTTPMRSLDVLPRSERRRLLVEWNATEAGYLSYQCVHELFEARVADNPDAMAVTCGDIHLTYGELNARANRLAHYLSAMGVKPDARVALSMERSLDMVVALLAILKAGGAYVPLDPTYPIERLAYMVEDAAPAAVLTHTQVLAEVRSALAKAGVPMIDLEADAWRWANEAGADRDKSAVGLTPEHLAYVIYTSGSTGRPKGVMNEHRGVVNRLLWMQDAYGLTEDDAVLQKTPFGFDVSVWEFFWPLLSGARLVMARPEGHKDPDYLASVIQQQRVTTLHFVPPMLQAFLDSGEATRCSSLARVICSGESLPGSLAGRFHQRLTTARLYNLYGPTEAAVDVTAWTCVADVRQESIPIGRPIANTKIYILDGNGEPAPVGVAGEIHIGGAQVARGYLNRPELTAERFVACPFAVERNSRMYKTGDLGRYLPDGNIEFLGRNDFQVKIRGFRIELGEIEARLTQHPAIREAVVLALEDGSGVKRLVAYYTRTTAGASADKVDAESLRAHLLAALPEYMAPAAYMALDALPITPNGKLDRRALPAPDGTGYTIRKYEAPVGEIESRLARIWADLLKLERVGRSDHFFELGGHSLLAIKVIERMRRDGLHADVRALFAAPTLAAFAAAVGGDSRVVDVPANRIPPQCDAITPEMLPLIDLTSDDIERIVGAAPGGAANIQDIYPLAPLQEGILFHYLMAAEGDVYLTPALLSFDTRTRLDAHVQALQAVIDRHDILRTAILWEGLPEPAQVVLRKAPLIAQEISFNPDVDDVAEQLRTRFDPRRYRIDIRHAPLIRVIIAHDQRQARWVTMHLFHHLSVDHTTIEALLREIQAHLSGQAAQLPAPIPFRNFVAQARLGVSREEHERFFREMLADVDEPTAPYGLTNAHGDGSDIREARQEIDALLAGRMRERARALGASPASLCHLAWARVLSRVSGRDDVVFGTVLFGRMQGGEGADRALGMFINTLPIRIRMGDDSVQDAVRQTHALLAQLMRHEHAPLALAQRCSGVGPPTPLFAALLNYRHSLEAIEIQSDARTAWEGVDFLGGEERTNYPFNLNVDDLGEGFSLNAQTQAPIDPDRICAYMRAALEQLVEALERAPETPARNLDALPACERRQLMAQWNGSASEYPRDQLIHTLFEQKAAMAPDAIAVAHEDRQLSFAELNVQANRLARYLCGLGAQPDARVAIMLERSIELVVAELAVLKCGAAYAPLDRRAPVERQAFMIEDCQARIILTAEDLEAPEIAGVKRVNIDSLTLTEEAPNDLTMALSSEAGAYVIYTSGSTGQPKGMVIPHRAIGRLVINNGYAAFEAGDRVAFTSNPAFDASTMEVWAPLLHGGCLVIIPEATLLEPNALAALLRKEQVNILHLVAGLLGAYADKLAPVFPRLRYLLTGGDVVDPRAVAKILRNSPPQRLIHCYGPSESTTFATTHEVTEVPEGATSIPIGRPIANTQVYLLDNAGRPAPVGVVGELYIGGAGVAWGYLNRPDLTAERFVGLRIEDSGLRIDRIEEGVAKDAAKDGGTAIRNPQSAIEYSPIRAYKTGDLARYLPDGAIEFLGRNDFQVKIRGVRIEPGEIEARLAQHPAVREAVVLAREDSPGDKRLVAYYTVKAAGNGAGAAAAEAAVMTASAEALRAHLSAVLPDQMMPAAYVMLDALPLTSNGKLDRKALPAPRGASHAVREYEAPKSETEIALAGVWAELLKLERVGRRDNFFELGGHSLLAVSLIERMRRKGLHADVRTLFAAPTLAALAAEVGGDSGIVDVPPNRIPDGCGAITPEMLPLVELSVVEIERVVSAVPGGAANIQDIYPLAPLQEGMLFHHLMETEGDPYLLHSLYSFDTQPRLDGFLHALQAVIARHDILRTAVVWEGLPEPVQVVWRQAPLTVEEVSLDPGAGDVAEQLLARFHPRRRRIDVRQAPLMRVAIAYDKPKDRWAVLHLFHHLSADHTTLEVLLREVQARLLGRAEQWAAPISFRNFVAQARLGVSREEHESFFRKMLSDVDEPTAPYGLVNAHSDGSDILEAWQEVDALLARRARESARSLGVSAASLCHLAWAKALAMVSGRDDVVFGTVVFGRMQGGEGSDSVLGLFINTLPVRIRIGDDSVEDSVRQTHGLLAQLLRHEHAPLALAQRCSAIAAPTPLFSALLNYRHNAAANTRGDIAGESAQTWEGIEFLAGEERTNYPFNLNVDDLGEGFALNAQAQSPADPNRICAYMRTVLEQLVEALERAPKTPIRGLDGLPASERHQLLEIGNGAESEYPRDQLIHTLFEQKAAVAPDAVAVVDEDRTLTFFELNARANRLARYLRGLGVQPHMRVAILLERSIELALAELAVLKCGAAYAPLDRNAPAERQSFMIEDCQAGIVLTVKDLEAPAVAGVKRIDIDALTLDEQASQNITITLSSETPAYIMYTSGSTGQPKGVVIPHRAIGRLVLNNHYAAFEAGDRVAFTSNPAFDASVMEMWAPLLHGARIVMVSQAALMDANAMADLLRREQVSILHLVAGLLGAYADALSAVFPTLRYLLTGGDVVDPRAVAKILRNSPPQHLIHCYGPSESTTFATTHEPPEVPEGATSIPIGRPIANTQVYLLDSAGRLAPFGAVGEVHIAGDGLAIGYLNRPDLTAERFVANPFTNRPGARISPRMYRTGDLARYLPDGAIEFLGRNDFQVKIRGVRIEPGEIEAKLAEHPAVQEAIVLAREDSPGAKRLVAYYTVATDAVVDAEALRAHLSARLPQQMVPEAYVVLDALPLTPNGKLDRKALPVPESTVYAPRAYEAPVGETESLLARIWADALRLERVGRHDNFFELGGHSLLAVSLIERMRREGLDADMRTLFTTPNLAEFAAAIEQTEIAL